VAVGEEQFAVMMMMMGSGRLGVLIIGRGSSGSAWMGCCCC
jgi:hypothetical protein